MNMNLNSKNTQILILGITSIICSRVMFAFFDDPEGPNLLVVIVAAMVLYSLSIVVYSFSFEKRNIVLNSSTVNYKKLLIAIFSQIIAAVIFFALL